MNTSVRSAALRAGLLLLGASGCERVAKSRPSFDADGSVLLPLTCVDQRIQGETLDVDLPVAFVSGTITLNGGPLPPRTWSRNGSIVFVMRGQRSEATVSLSFAGREYGIALVRGMYDVLFVPSQCQPQDSIPCTHAVLARGVLIDRDTELNLDLRAVRARYTVDVDGRPLIEGTPAVLLVNEAGEFAGLPPESASVGIPITPGRYSVVLSSRLPCVPGSVVPCGSTTIASDVVFDESVVRRFSVATSLVDVSVSLGATRWPLSSTRDAQLVLADPDGRRIAFSLPATGSLFNLRVARGHYVLLYRPSTSVPCDPQRSIVCNEGPLGEFDATERDQRISLSARAVTLSGRVTVDGVAPVGASPGLAGRILVRRGQDTWSVRVDSTGRFSFRVMEHTRASLAFVSDATACLADTPLPGLACGGAAFASEQEFVRDQEYEVALRTHGPRVSLVVGGRTASEATDPSTTLLFTPSTGGGAVNVHFGSEFPVRLIEGDYRVTLTHSAFGQALPQGTHVLERALRVASSGDLRVEARPRTLLGRLRYDGLEQPFAAGSGPSVWLFVNGGASTRATMTDATSFSATIVDGPVSVMVGHGPCELGQRSAVAFCSAHWVTSCP